MSGGEARQVTFVENGISSYKWIDNSAIAYTAHEPRDEAITDAEEKAGGGYIVGTRGRTSALWIQSLEDKSNATKVTDGSYFISDFAPSSDGKHFVLITSKYSDLYTQITGSQVMLIDNKGNNLFTFKDAKGFGNPGFSPDNGKISFVANTVGYSARNALFVTDIKSKTTQNFTEEFDPTIQGVQWLDDETITFVSLRKTYTGIYGVSLKTGAIKSLMDPHFVTFSYSLNPATGQIAFYGSHGMNPSALYIHNAYEAPKNTRVLLSPNKWMKNKDLAFTKVVKYPSFDGETIEAVVTFPPGYDENRKYPLMVLPHGGPDGMSLDDFGLFGQLFAQEGIIVFEANFRGGIGFGSDLYRANRGRLGDIDYKDIMTGVDYLIRQGIIDETKMVVGGWSYGGYMTNWVIGHTDRFKAAVSVAGIANTVSMYAQSDINHGELARWEFKGVPVLNMENFTRSSPLPSLKNCKTPTLIIHGESDNRVPVAQAWEIYRALTDIGTEVQMVLYPGAGHGISAPKQYADVMTRWVDWYNRFIKE